MSNEKTSDHAISPAVDPEILEEIITKAFSKNGKELSCKSPSCAQVIVNTKEEALTHFCHQHLEGLSPYVCTCGRGYKHRTSSLRHYKTAREREGIPIDKNPFDSPCCIDTRLEFTVAFFRWLWENGMIWDGIQPARDTHEVTGNQLESVPDNRPLSGTDIQLETAPAEYSDAITSFEEWLSTNFKDLAENREECSTFNPHAS